MIPLGTDRPLRRPSAVVPALIAITVGVFLANLVIGWSNPESGARLVEAGWVGGGQTAWYRFVTSLFLHAGWMHLLGNMLFLWVFGPPVEDRMGRGWFALFYVLAGVASGALHAWLEPAPAIGASGAISGVAGAFVVLFPLTRIRTLMVFGLFGFLMIPSWFFVGLKIVFDLFDQSFRRDDVANLAHLGGYGFGILVALGLLWSGVLAREPYDMFTMLRHRRRRGQIRAAARGVTTRPVLAARTGRIDPEIDELADRRARVSSLVAADRLGEAADAYAELTNSYAHRPHAGTLARDAQLKLVGYLLGHGRRELAARALEGFVATYPKDPERRPVILLLGRVYARDLGNAKRARELLAPIAAQSEDSGSRDLAQAELELLGTEPTKAPTAAPTAAPTTEPMP